MNRSVRGKPTRDNVSAIAEISFANTPPAESGIEVALSVKPEYRNSSIEPNGGDHP